MVSKRTYTSNGPWGGSLSTVLARRALVSALPAVVMGLGLAAPPARLLQARDLPNAPEMPVARVTRVSGVAEMDELAGRGIRRLRVGADIFIGDRIITGVNTRIAIALRDGTAIVLGELSMLTIDGFAFDAETKTGRAGVTLRKGVMRMLPGGIHGFSDDGVTVRTPMALIKAGGSDLWVHQHARNTELLLLGGSGFDVRNSAGTVMVSEVGAVSTVVGRDVPPTEPVLLPKEVVETARLAVSF